MRFPVSGMLMVLIGGFIFFIWIMFRYAFRELQNVLWASANQTMSGPQLRGFESNLDQLMDGFGLVGVLFIGIAVVIFVVDAFRGPRREM